MTPEVCPNCEAEVPAGARACPECGADESTGWSPGAQCERLGIPDPDDEFDYGAFIQREFGSRQKAGRRMKPAWLLAALALIIVLLLWAL